MDALVILIIVGGVAFALGKIWNALRGPSGAKAHTAGRISVRIDGRNSSDQGKVSVTETRDGVIFNKDGRIPITLYGVTKKEIDPIVDGIRNYEYPVKLKEQLGLLIAQKNAESPEVEEFLHDFQKRYDRELEAELSREPGYEDWPAADKEDFEAEAHEAVSEKLPLCSPFEDISVLMKDRPEDVTADDAVTRRFEGDTEGLRLYLRLCSRKKPLEASDRAERKALEKLADEGLAIRGKGIPKDELLGQLRMKDIQRILGEKAPKKFTRKAEAVEFAAKTEGIEDLIAEEIPLRSTYQASNPPGDVEAAARAFRFGTQYAGLIVTTLITESQGQRNYQDGKIFEAERNDCIYCNKYSGKEFTKRASQPFPPHHIGCACYLSVVEFE